MLGSLASGLHAVIRIWSLLALALAGTLALALLAIGWLLPHLDGARELLLAAAGPCLLLRSSLDGGWLGVLRTPTGSWQLRGFLRGCGFYLGRLLRVAMLVAAVAGLLLATGAPLARGADPLLRGAAAPGAPPLSAQGGLALLGLVAFHAVWGYAKVILVCDERRSALLAIVSSLGFCARNLTAVGGQYLLVSAVGLGLLALVAAGSAVFRLAALTTLAVGLGLGLQAAQVALYRARGR